MQYVDRVLLNEDGTEASEAGKPATALLGIKRALVTDAKALDGAIKARRYELFTKLLCEDAVELTVDEVALAKDAIEIYPTLVYGQLLAFLNQK